jgi:hypothetical protein
VGGYGQCMGGTNGGGSAFFRQKGNGVLVYFLPNNSISKGTTFWVQKDGGTSFILTYDPL